MERIEVTRSERNEVENARDAMHRAVIDILKARGLDYMAADLSEVAELIALEGYFDATIRNTDEVEYILDGGEAREV